MTNVRLPSLLSRRGPSTAYMRALVRNLKRENGKLIVSYSDDTGIFPRRLPERERRCPIERQLQHIDRLRRHYRWKY